jgi:hypothetical protein
MAKIPQSEDEKNLDVVLNRMLNMPHKPHEPLKKKANNMARKRVKNAKP